MNGWLLGQQTICLYRGLTLKSGDSEEGRATRTAACEDLTRILGANSAVLAALEPAVTSLTPLT